MKSVFLVFRNNFKKKKKKNYIECLVSFLRRGYLKIEENKNLQYNNDIFFSNNNNNNDEISFYDLFYILFYLFDVLHLLLLTNFMV